LTLSLRARTGLFDFVGCADTLSPANLSQLSHVAFESLAVWALEGEVPAPAVNDFVARRVADLVSGLLVALEEDFVAGRDSLWL
jgi:hypothetical protein